MCPTSIPRTISSPPARAVGARITQNNASGVGYESRFGKVAPEVDPREVVARLVRAADKIRHRRDASVRYDPNALADPDRPDVSGAAVQVSLDFRLGGESERVQSWQLLGLDLVKLVVASPQQQGQFV